MIDRLQNSDKYRDRFAWRLLSGIGGKLIQPERMSTLSMEEEEAGVKAYWKEFDAALRLAAFGIKKLPTLQNIYAAGAECIHWCSDQIPVHTCG